MRIWIGVRPSCIMPPIGQFRSCYTPGRVEPGLRLRHLLLGFAASDAVGDLQAPGYGYFGGAVPATRSAFKTPNA
jgi:hypothetical protein